MFEFFSCGLSWAVRNAWCRQQSLTSPCLLQSAPGLHVFSRDGVSLQSAPVCRNSNGLELKGLLTGIHRALLWLRFWPKFRPINVDQDGLYYKLNGEKCHHIK